MLTRREFVAILGALPVIRLLPGVRLGCQHQWEGFKTHKRDGYSLDSTGGPRHEWLRGAQCQTCGHIRVTERVTVRWGRLES